MSVINTNITSMIGQQNLRESQNALQTSMERLSSGLRINSAKDDAAGQAIANRMSAQITGLAQAQRNANDGISVAQTAEGGLDQVNENLQRIRELSVQAENGTNSQDDLNSIQDEINQRLEEIDRISRETDFNGTKVLASDDGLKIQVGSEDGQAINIGLRTINRETLGLEGFNVNGSGEVANTAATRDSLISAADGNGNVRVSGGASGVGSDTEQFFLQTENAVATGSQLLGSITSGSVTVTEGGAATTDATALGFNISGATITGGTFTVNSDGNFEATLTGISGGNTQTTDLASFMNANAGEAPREASYDFGGGAAQDILIDSDGNITDRSGNQMYLTENGELTLNSSGANSVQATTDALAADMMSGGVATTGAALSFTDGPTIRATTDEAVEIDVTLTAEELQNRAAAAGDEISVADANVSGSATYQANAYIQTNGNVTSDSGGATALYVDGSTSALAFTTNEDTETELFVRESGIVTDTNGVQYYEDADGNLTSEATTAGERTDNPLDKLDEALQNVDSLRSELGAAQNRFESAITNLSTNETNLSAARSRIEDADYAMEVADMTRAQILQQAGTSVLAQANQLPQSVLSLLG